MSWVSAAVHAPVEEERLKEVYVRYFKTVIVRDEAALAAAHKLRYQVYCVENPFEDPADNPDGLERDLYDARATHCLLVHRPSETVAGTVRLVLPDRQQPDRSFSLQEVCQDSLVRDPAAFPVARMAEISRFCVAKEFRRRHAAATVKGFTAATRAKTTSRTTAGSFPT